MGSFVAAHGLSSCGARALECTDSVVAARGLSCLEAFGDLPRPGLEPVSRVLAGRFLTTGPLGKSFDTVLNYACPFLLLSH